MPYSLQEFGGGAVDLRARPFAVGFDIMAAAIEGVDCVLSGCAVSPNAGLVLNVDKGAVLTNGVLKAVAAATVTIGAADANYWRIDLVVINSAGTKAVRAGTAGVMPRPPARTANDVVLAFVFVQAAVTTVIAGDLADMRPMRTTGPICIHKTVSATTINNTAVATVLWQLVIPNGLFLTGRQLAVRLGGNYLSNSGAPTWTWQIRASGIGVWSDLTAATVADADRGAWDLDFVLTAYSASSQRLNGRMLFQTPGAKNAATTGLGDLAVTTHISTPLRHTDVSLYGNADVTIDVRVTMSVANAAVETVLDHAFVTLQ